MLSRCYLLTELQEKLQNGCIVDLVIGMPRIVVETGSVVKVLLQAAVGDIAADYDGAAVSALDSSYW